MTVQLGKAVAVLMLLTSACSRAPAEEDAKNAVPAVVDAARPAPVTNSPDNVSSPSTVAVDVAKTAVPDLPEDETDTNSTQDKMAFPDEVTDFMVARDSCDHFRGEDAYDEDRRAYLDDNIRSLCTGTDAKLADLRMRYRKDSEVMAALKGYEDQIEAPTTHE